MELAKFFARKSDPETSHMAAAQHDRERVIGIRDGVKRLLVISMTDEQLVDAYEAAAEAKLVKYATPQAIRSARAQLVHMGQVEPVPGVYGETRLGNKCRVWIAVPVEECAE